MTPFSASRMKRSLALLQALMLAFAPLVEASARPVKKAKEPVLTFMSENFGGKKVARVKRSLIRPGASTTGFVVEKFNERGSILDRVANWDDVTVVEIDRNSDGYLDEWEAFSDRGHIRLSKPRGGHFTQMSAEMIHRDRRYTMFFLRDANGVFRLNQRRVAKLQVQWADGETMGSGTPAQAGGSESNANQDTAAQWNEKFVKPLRNSDNLSRSVGKEGLAEKIIDLSSCKDDDSFKKDYSKIRKALGEVLVSDDKKHYLTCMRAHGLDAAANVIEARMYRKIQPQAPSPWKLACRDCSKEDNSQSKVCQGKPEARAAFDETQTDDNSGNGSIYLIRPKQQAGAQKSESRSLRQYQDDLFHEMLHMAKLKDETGQVKAVMACCSMTEKTAKGCETLSQIIGNGSFHKDGPFGSAAPQNSNPAAGAPPTNMSAADRPAGHSPSHGSQAPSAGTGGSQASAPASAPSAPALPPPSALPQNPIPRPAAPPPPPQAPQPQQQAQAPAPVPNPQQAPNLPPQPASRPADSTGAGGPQQTSAADRGGSDGSAGGTSAPAPQGGAASPADAAAQASGGGAGKPSDSAPQGGATAAQVGSAPRGQASTVAAPTTANPRTGDSSVATGPLPKTQAAPPTANQAMSGADSRTGAAPTVSAPSAASTSSSTPAGSTSSSSTASSATTASTSPTTSSSTSATSASSSSPSSSSSTSSASSTSASNSNSGSSSDRTSSADTPSQPKTSSSAASSTSTSGASSGSDSGSGASSSQRLSKADVQAPTAAQSTAPRADSSKSDADSKPDSSAKADSDSGSKADTTAKSDSTAKTTSSGSSSSGSSSGSSGGSSGAQSSDSRRVERGPARVRDYDPQSARVVAASFSQILNAAVSVISQNSAAPAVVNPSEPAQGKKGPAAPPVAARGLRPDEGPAPQSLAQPKPGAVAVVSSRGPASVVDPKVAKDSQPGSKAMPSAPKVSLAEKGRADTKAPPSKNLFAATTPLAAVRQKAKRGNPAARKYFIKQMTLLDRDEMRLALADREVQNSLREYVIGAIDDRHKRRDQSANPKDWLIYNEQKKRLVHKQLGLAKK